MAGHWSLASGHCSDSQRRALFGEAVHAATDPHHTVRVEPLPLAQANLALDRLRDGRLPGAAVRTMEGA